MVASHDEALTAAECASRLGLTVRALRVYERLGLIRPGRTQKNWRLYGAGDIARLHEIIALKQFGLSLVRIADLVAGRDTDLDRTLAMQEAALADLRERTGRSLALVGALRVRLASGGRPSIDDLVRLARETNMTAEQSDAIAWRRYEQARPRTEVAIDPALYAGYAGHYQFADGTTYVVTTRDGRLFVRVMGQPEVEAFPEAADRFFLKLVPAQITFIRGDDGSVTRLVHHQSGYDEEAPRVPEEVVRDAEAALADRIRTRTPLPAGEAILRRVIEEQQRGEPDYDAMTPPLADLVRSQLPLIRDDLARRGAPRDISFRGVGPTGIDVYEVRFDETTLEWGLALAPDGRIASLYLRPLT